MNTTVFNNRGTRRLVIVALMLAASTALVTAQHGATGGEWRTYGGDLGNTRYAPLDQITAANFNTLEVAWRFKTDHLGPRPEFNLEATPLMVGGVLFSTAGSRRAVVALNAATGELLWMHNEDEGSRGAASPRPLSGRGLAYWSDGTNARILYVTRGYRLIALDAKTGVPVSSFGKAGVVDLKLDDDQDMDLVKGEIGLHAAPIVSGNTIVVGASHSAGSIPKGKRNEKGYVRGFDVKTGKRLWIFHTIPLPGEFGNDTWEKDSWAYTGNTGVWGQMSIDEELGLLYLPVELPTGDFYGGDRPGAGLFGESLVALDLKTGKRKWHYQLVHHGMWDMDIPCAPVLVDITVNGRLVKAVAQPTKQAWLYVFDRATGQPVWPIVEKPVAKGDVPGEWYSPTQPFPSKPPAYDRQGVSPDDLIDFTSELKAEGLKLASLYRMGPIFTPPSVSKWEGPRGTLTLPSAGGGTNWPGGSFDPETGIFYVYSTTSIVSIGLIPTPDPKLTDIAYIEGAPRDPNGPTGPGVALGGPTIPAGAEGANATPTVRGLPFVKPPYGRITAIDLTKGDILWQIAHGETPDAVRNHAALKGVTIPRTGRAGRVGTLVTKTLVIAAEAGGVVTLPDGRRGAMLRAYDKPTGKEMGAVYMPAPETGSPMTYMLNGRQYIVLAIGGGAYASEFVAYALPAPSKP